MTKSLFDDPEADSAPQDRFTVIVEITVDADSADDAEDDVKDIISKGILALIDEDDREPIHAWDITSSDPAEVF
jgi:hypothetical protein